MGRVCTLDADHDDGLVAKYQRMEDLLGGGEPSELAARELEESYFTLLVGLLIWILI